MIGDTIEWYHWMGCKTATEDTEFQRACRNLVLEHDRLFERSLCLINVAMWNLRVFAFKLRFRKELAVLNETRQEFFSGLS